ncbi:RpiB/LacA/LacB family sugar-phosphate isomerase [Candidatus Microgenomates bacterium]|nr:RpiB/LacA/LacB family sugar-phosphate isomerase [Candidatus Microgenomates bacterium]
MIYLGCDHGGFDLKEKIKKWLVRWGYSFEDLGNTIYDKDDDYPKYAFAVARRVAEEEFSGRKYPMPWKDRPKGILCCRSAAGMVMAANRIKGIRAFATSDAKKAMRSRDHNDANIIALSGDWLEDYQAKKLIKAWLSTEFSGEERHIRRLKMLDEYDVSV